MSEIGAILVLVGAALTALAGLGMLRFPDVYTRLHAASKAGPLGAGLILLGVGVASADWSVLLRAIVGFAFLILTSPVSAHLVARAALHTDVPADPATTRDEFPVEDPPG